MCWSVGLLVCWSVWCLGVVSLRTLQYLGLRVYGAVRFTCAVRAGIIHLFGTSLRRHDSAVLAESQLLLQLQALELRLNAAALAGVYGQRTPRVLGDQAYAETNYISSQVRTARLNALAHANPALRLQLIERNAKNKA